jgi:hypothetical protein
MSVVNADKPPLEVNDLEERVQQFFSGGSGSTTTTTTTTSTTTITATTATTDSSSSSSSSSGDSSTRVVVTNQPLYFSPSDGGGKAKLFPNCTFVVGVDTAVRVLNPKYYNNSDVEMLTALSTIRYSYNCSFLVAGRLDAGDNGQSQFLTFDLESMGLSPAVHSMCNGMFFAMSEDDFRVDLSSTEIRARRAAATQSRL